MGLAACGAGLTLVMLARRQRASRPARAVQSACWLAGAIAATWAMMLPGGLSIPACSLAVGLLWGLAPAAMRVEFARRSGWWLVGVLVALAAMLGLMRQDGLVGWISLAMGGRDVSLHVLAGALVTLGAAWLVGSRRLAAGLLAAAVAALSGGLAELLQGWFSDRGAELRDWQMHLVGSAAATVLYVLAWLWGWSRRGERRAAAEGDAGRPA